MSGSLAVFRGSFIFTLAGLVLAAWLGWYFTSTLTGALGFFVTCAVLAVLEISLSFDNAVVNANKLQTMTPVWQKRFLTWGILIAVFGMRIVFPLLIVVIAADLGPVAAIVLAASDPTGYAAIIREAHLSIAAFGGTFLMMVSLSYFVDEGKEVDWFQRLEKRLRSCASVRGLEVAIVLSLVMLISVALPGESGKEFLFAAIAGLLTFLAVAALGHVLDAKQKAQATARSGGLGAFLYLETLDASFSFDGVIGAFALTQNLFLIAIGLGIGAFYVRSMTILLVERRVLAEFRYLEHGAFYSILVLSLLMFAQTMFHIPELVTGLASACLIGCALLSSVRYKNTVASR